MWKKAFDVRIYNLNISLILALASWQICEVTEEDAKFDFSSLSQISGEWWIDIALIRWHTSRTLDDVSPRSDFTFLVLGAAPRESTINVLEVGWLPATSPYTDSFSLSARRSWSYWWLSGFMVNLFVQLVNVRHVERFFAMMKSMNAVAQVILQGVLRLWTQAKPGRWDAYVFENPRLAAFSIVPLPSSHLESDGYLTNSPPSASR